MALVKCPDCEREVSSKASTCPGCARPLRSEKVARGEEQARRARVLIALGTVGVLGGLVCAITSSGTVGVIAMGAGFLVFVVGRLSQS